VLLLSLVCKSRGARELEEACALALKTGRGSGQCGLVSPDQSSQELERMKQQKQRARSQQPR